MGSCGGHEPCTSAHLAVCGQCDQVDRSVYVEFIPLARRIVWHAGYFPVQALDKDPVTEGSEMVTRRYQRVCGPETRSFGRVPALTRERALTRAACGDGQGMRWTCGKSGVRV
jgi:hypothetical protein